MNLKKGFLSIIFSLSLSPLISAQQLPAPPLAFNGITDFLKLLLSGNGANSEIIARILIFLVLGIVLYKPSVNIVGESNKKWGVILSMIISIMAVRFFDANMVKGLLLPYGALGVVLSTFIPFILLEYFFIAQKDILPETFRKIGYLLMIGTFFGMWWFRWTEIGDLAYYYLGAAGVSLLTFWFDGTLRNWYKTSRIHSARKRHAYMEIVRLEHELKEKMEGLAIASRTEDKEGIKDFKEEIKGIEKAIDILQKA